MNYVTAAIREWAWNVGSDPQNIERQWLLSDYDSWERNPHYKGPDMGHPEDDREAPEADEWMTVGLNTGANDPPYYNARENAPPPYFAPIGGSADDDIPF